MATFLKVEEKSISSCNGLNAPGGVLLPFLLTLKNLLC